MLKNSDWQAWTNSVDPDQNAAECSIWSVSTATSPEVLYMYIQVV